MAQKRLKNRLAALKYVNEKMGFSVSQAKFYLDVKEGKINVQKDGSIRFQDLEKYSKVHLADRYRKLANIDDLTRRKKELENERLEQQNYLLQLKRDRETGMLISREDALKEMTALLIMMESSLRHMFHMNAPVWLAKYGGDQSRLKEFLEDLDLTLDHLMTQSASNSHIESIMEAS